MQQVLRLRTGEHRLPVRQIDRGDSALTQGAAHRIGFGAGTHQHGDIGRTQAGELAARPPQGGLHPLGERRRRSRSVGANGPVAGPPQGGASPLGGQRRRSRSVGASFHPSRFAAKTGLRVVQQGDDALGAVLGETLPHRFAGAHFGIVHELQRRNRTRPADQRLPPPLRLNRDEGYGVLRGRGIGHAKLERALARPVFGLGKQPVDCRHQRPCGAVIGREHVVPARGGSAGAEIAADVGPAKGVDRLLGVADEEDVRHGSQRPGSGTVRRQVVEPVEQAVLQGRCVLELVDQGHGILLQDARAQALAACAGQRGIQAFEHVAKSERARSQLEFADASADAGGGILAQGRGDVGNRVERRFEPCDVLKGGWNLDRLALPAGLGQPVRGQALPGPVVQAGIVPIRRSCPGVELIEPFLDAGRLEQCLAEWTRCGRQVSHQPDAHRLEPLRPTGLELSQRGGPPPPQLPPQRAQRRRRPLARRDVAHQPAQIAFELVHGRPDLQHGIEFVRRERIHLLPPEIAHRLRSELAFIGEQFLVEQAAAVERMLAQHALAPGVDGEYRCLVHRLRRHRQTPGRRQPCLALDVIVDQALEKRVFRPGLLLAAKAACRLDQTGPNAVGQFPRRSAGEGHDQDLVGGQRAGKRRACGAMAEHQPQIQGGYGPRLAGPGAGLDQPAAPQGHVPRIEDFTHRARPPQLCPDRRCALSVPPRCAPIRRAAQRAGTRSARIAHPRSGRRSLDRSGPGRARPLP
ncbi:hypothetical protein GALL_436630 [mine drainage metagenome]|uniref:Uncharacterized protein n=1 Tax=mine drainage metagenome TaxID=410659 RepID=A0A1J5PUY5_9ZZZZ